MRSLALLVLIAVVPPAITAAQFDSGQISGFVRDSQQGALPGATVTLTSERTGSKRTAVTNASGFYVMPDVPVGSYAITVELQGFKKFSQPGIRLSAASQIAVCSTTAGGEF